MTNKLLLPAILFILGYGFWISPEFKVISAGVAIFLFGMFALESGFNTFSGGILQRILQSSTDTLPKSLSFGIIATTIMQSSSLVSVITISFLSAGLIGLAAGIGIIFGANLGTTTGAWIIAGFGLKVKISAYAMPMLVFGCILSFQNSSKLKGIGSILAGLGFLFLGIHYMKEGFDTFKDTIDLAQFAVSGFSGLMIYTALGIAATVIMQSSHATMVLIITALSAGQISYENSLALAIGANIGTTITAIIGAMSANTQGKRLAGAHLIFNLVTALIAILLIQQFIWAVDVISASVGIPYEDYSLKLAVFHTVFNLIGIIVMLPFVNHLVKFLAKILPTQAEPIDKPKYLDKASSLYPSAAVNAVRKETMRLLNKSLKIVSAGIGLKRKHIRGRTDLRQLVSDNRQFSDIDLDEKYELHIKSIFSAIIQFISVSAVHSQDSEAGDFYWLRDANKNIVNAVKDTKHMYNNVSKYANSPNNDIRHGYDAIRELVACSIKVIDKIARAKSPEEHEHLLQELSKQIQDSYEEINRTIEVLIRTNAINPLMGTSLINDSTYAYNITRNLTEACHTLYVAHNPEQPEGGIPPEETDMVDDAELEAIENMTDTAEATNTSRQ